MSSLRNFVSFTFLSLLSLGLVDAKPVARRAAGSPTPTSLRLPVDVVYPSTLPLVADSSSLPAPPANLTLQHVTIGHGVQNYTCQSNLSAAPVALGAVATLYDVTPLALLSSTTVSQIPAIAAFLPLTKSIVPNTPLTIPGLGAFQILGYHYFAADGTPVLDLTNVGEILFGKKVADIKAPANASKGIDNAGAVDWLALTAMEGSVGVGEVFRVDTAGGNPPATCKGYAAGDLVSVPYSAAYHFYA